MGYCFASGRAWPGRAGEGSSRWADGVEGPVPVTVTGEFSPRWAARSSSTSTMEDTKAGSVATVSARSSRTPRRAAGLLRLGVEVERPPCSADEADGDDDGTGQRVRVVRSLLKSLISGSSQRACGAPTAAIDGS